MSNISIVIPFYNQQDLTFINKLASMDSFKEVEVVIVDDGSKKEYADRLAALKFKNIKIVTHEKNRGRWHTLATGYASVSGDIIARCDDDSFFKKEWVEDVKKIFSDEEVIAAGGPQLNYSKNFFAQAGSWMSNLKRTEESSSDSIILNGSGMIVRREVLEKIKGVDVNMVDSEDRELAIRIANYAKKNNKKIVYSSKLTTYTTYATSIFSELKRKIRWGRGRFYIYTKYHSLGMDFYLKLALLILLIFSLYQLSWISTVIFLSPAILVFFQSIKNKTFRLKYWLASPLLAWLRIFGLIFGCLSAAIDYGLK